MEPLISTISVHLLSDFIYDIIKLEKSEKTSPLSEAIESTERYFDGIEGLGVTIQQWLLDPRVADILNSYIEGQTGNSELPLSTLVAKLADDTQFYLGDASTACGKEVIDVFLTKIRSAYLRVPSTAGLHIANRQETRFDAVDEQLRQLKVMIEASEGLGTSLQARFDEATAKIDSEDFPAASVLFESLLADLERAPRRDRKIERRIHVSLGNIAIRFFEQAKAAKHFRAAAELDDDPIRAAVNLAAADLTEQKPQEALDRLRNLSGVESSPLVYECAATRAQALLQLGRSHEAIEALRSIEASGKEVQRLELLGLAYREAGRIDDAERTYREALTLEPSRPELQHVLAHAVIVSGIDFHNQYPGLPVPPPIKDKIEETASLLQAAAAKFRAQGRIRAALEADGALAVAHVLQDRLSDAIRILEPVTQSDVATANDWRTLGFAYAKSNEFNRAAFAFKNAISRRRDSETEFLYAETLLLAGKPDDALEFVSDKAALPVSQSNVLFHVVKTRALLAKRQFSKAREAIELAQKQLPDDADVLLASAELYFAVGQHAEATREFESALKNATGAAETRVRFTFGGFAAAQKKFTQAVDLWKPLIHCDKPSHLLDNYVRAAFNCRRFSEITVIAEKVRNAGTQASAVFADVAAAAYERLDGLVEAGYWLECLGNRYGNRPEHIIRLSQIKLRLGEREQAIELLDASRATLTEAKDIMGFAQAYSILGKHREAIELGYSATLPANSADHCCPGKLSE